MNVFRIFSGTGMFFRMETLAKTFLTASKHVIKGSVKHFQHEILQPGILDSFLMVTISMSVDIV